MTKPVTIINSFEVPVGREDEFVELWKRMDDYQMKQPGFISRRLHRSLSPDAKLRFINIIQFESLELYQATTRSPGFKEVNDNRPAAWSTDFPKTLGVPYEVILDSDKGE